MSQNLPPCHTALHLYDFFLVPLASKWPQICKRKSKNISHPIQQWAKNLNRHFPKEVIQMVSKPMKRCSMSLGKLKLKPHWDFVSYALGILQSKTEEEKKEDEKGEGRKRRRRTRRRRGRRGRSRRKENNKCWQGCGKIRTLIHCLRGMKDGRSTMVNALVVS